MGMKKRVFERTLLVAIETSVWGGERQSQMKSLGEERHIAADLPPEKVAKSFAKKVIDTKHLRLFRRLRNQQHEACMAVGVQLKDRSGIYAIPESEIDDLVREFEAIEKEYQEALSVFLDNYSRYVQEWIDANAEWGEWIRKSTLSLSEVKKRFSYGFFITGFDPDKRSDGRMEKKAEELGETLVQEIAQVAEAFWERTLRGRQEAGVRILGPMKRIRRKLAACRFLNPVVDDGIAQIDEIMAKMPKSGKLSQENLKDLVVLTLRFAKGNLSVPGKSATAEEDLEETLEELSVEVIESMSAEPEPAEESVVPPTQGEEEPDYSAMLF